MDEHPASREEFITIARVLGPQGRHGEVVVESHTDAPERFKAGMRLLALTDDGSQHELIIDRLWPHKGHLVLKLAAIDSISDAEMLSGCELQVRRSERAQLESGLTYISDLIGCAVFNAGQEIGKILDVRFGAGEAPLLIVKAGKRELEIPYAQAYLRSLDLDRRQVNMLLPEGLLELDAPLSEEEKQQQRRSPEAGVRSQKRPADY
ncbi:MAG TPA: ribosome maturation factor RimM [Terriglobales bacterium]|nr:ribosome maturation factor RimM [Terriglobales bacterium]